MKLVLRYISETFLQDRGCKTEDLSAVVICLSSIKHYFSIIAFSFTRKHKSFAPQFQSCMKERKVHFYLDQKRRKWPQLHSSANMNKIDPSLRQNLSRFRIGLPELPHLQRRRTDSSSTPLEPHLSIFKVAHHIPVDSLS